MVKAAGEAEVDMMSDLVNLVIVGVIPAEWEIGTIVNSCTGMWGTLERGNHRGLKLTDHILELVERVIEKLIRQQVDINEI